MSPILRMALRDLGDCGLAAVILVCVIGLFELYPWVLLFLLGGAWVLMWLLFDREG